MVEHSAQKHPESKNMPFSMKINKFEHKNLHRQASEGQMITNSKADNLLNGRGDWGQNLPPKLVIEDSGRQIPKRKADTVKSVDNKQRIERGAQSAPPPTIEE